MVDMIFSSSMKRWDNREVWSVSVSLSLCSKDVQLESIIYTYTHVHNLVLSSCLA